MSSVLDIAKKINKSWKEDVLTDGNFTKEVKRLSMSDLGFDYPLYGGLPYGALTVFSGVEHSGKTTAAALAMAQYQKENPEKVCIWVDAENTLRVQGDFLERITGLNLSSEHFLRYEMAGKSAEEMFSDILQLQTADNIGMIVIDSAPALVSQADMDTEFEKDNGMRASIAKSIGKFIKQMQMMLPKQNNILLIINQVRITGKTFTGATIYSEPCGYALGYYPSLKVRFGTRTYTLADKTDIPATKAEETDGFRLKFSITKSRLGPANRGGGFLTFRLNTGLDVVNDMLEIAMKYGYIEHPNNITYILTNLDTNEPYLDEYGNVLKFAGKQKVIDFINTQPDFRQSYFEMLTRHVSSSVIKVDLLDVATMKEILQQEASVSNDEIENTSVVNEERQLLNE